MAFCFLIGCFQGNKNGWYYVAFLGGIGWHFGRVFGFLVGWYCMAFREVLRVYIRVVLGGGWLSDHSRKTKEKQRRNKEEIKKE